MNEPKIATALLALLASGGTMERVSNELPGFKAEIESAFEWMKCRAQRKKAEIGDWAMRLHEAVLKKNEAIKKTGFRSGGQYACRRGQNLRILRTGFPHSGKYGSHFACDRACTNGRANPAFIQTT
jgi:hypothetical protein